MSLAATATSLRRTFDEKDNVANTAPPEAHHEHGPNGGHIPRTGREYHAEVAMDQSRKLTVYLLDEHVKGAKPVENGTVQIVTKVDGNDVTLDLVAAPRIREDGKSSRFELVAEKVPGGRHGHRRSDREPDPQGR